MDRRGFLNAILAAAAAPAIVKAANIMPVFARRESGLLVPESGLLVPEVFSSSELVLTMDEFYRIVRSIRLPGFTGGGTEDFKVEKG
jgi:hypothetical protein